MKTHLRVFTAISLAFAFALAAAASHPRWVGTWATSPQRAEPHNKPPAPGLTDATLRQFVHVSLGGKRVRVRLSNEFSNSSVTLAGVRLARATGGSAIDPATDRALTFSGSPSVTLQVGALMYSDPIDFDLPPLSNVAITLKVVDAPSEITSHPGSRTTSYFQPGDALSAPEMPDATRVDRWYFITGIDVVADQPASAVAVIGDSITDGRGSTTNGNNRWPDNLARRLHAHPATAHLGVLNLGVGGGRLLRDGLGPHALSRLDRDVIAQAGVKHLIVFEGVNDLGTAVGPRAKGEPHATAADIIAAYEQIIVRAKTHDIRVYGATIPPFEGFTAYYAPESEADRQKVNAWIRTSGQFDAVIDFDAICRDPAHPTRLRAEVDSGDHLHPSAAGYQIMADAIDLKLFEL